MSTENNRRAFSTPNMNPRCMGFAFGATGLVFYLGCMLTLATVPHGAAVMFFNSLLHGLDVGPVLKTSEPLPQVALGLITTFVLAGSREC